MVTVIRPELCARCKGRLWCGLKKCPLLEAKRLVSDIRISPELSVESPPSVLVGWGGYPRVNVTPVVSLRDAWRSDNPPLWVEENYSIEDILDLRLHSGGGRRKVDVREPGRVSSTLQELAMSREPVPVDLYLEKPRPVPSFSRIFPPIGFTGALRKIELASNPRVDKLAEKFFYDEARAEEAVISLYHRGRDVYDIVRYFTAGLLGKEKRLVPTRWAITAVDDILSSNLLRRIMEYPSVDRVLFFHSNLYDNHFFIFFIPGPWAFELVEAWAPKSFWVRGKTVILSDSEVGRKRKAYADNVGGSYYASRLAVLEALDRMKRKASVLILREVREGYYAPLGVWQVRENVRNALKGKPLTFETLREALEYASRRMRIPLDEWRRHSVLLKGVQKTLF